MGQYKNDLILVLYFASLGRGERELHGFLFWRNKVVTFLGFFFCDVGIRGLMDCGFEY